ncbi:hypothetical protein GF371_03810 [Candidatus Woesearchaeota archaeon]|nr:hypothetical protein [Candidatus Woesearchaeota archaeon]
MPALLYVPIIHNKPSFIIPDKTDSEFGGIVAKIIADFWDDIEQELLHRRFDSLFMDGVMHDVRLSKAKELAEKERNWAFVCNQMKKGVRLKKTESNLFFYLYVIERSYMQKHKEKLTVENLKSALEVFDRNCFDQEEFAMLEKYCRGRRYFNGLDLRDRFVAKNVQASLESKERGLLLMGGDHDVLKYINGDIKIEKYISPVIEQLLD